MAGANAVFKAALGRTRSGSSFKGRSTRHSSISDTSTAKDTNGKLLGTSASSPNMHLATTGPGSSTPIGNATAEKRTYRPFAPAK